MTYHNSRYSHSNQAVGGVSDDCDVIITRVCDIDIQVVIVRKHKTSITTNTVVKCDFLSKVASHGHCETPTR